MSFFFLSDQAFIWRPDVLRKFYSEARGLETALPMLKNLSNECAVKAFDLNNPFYDVFLLFIELK